ncbi:hypothetical protein ACA910_006173 [Epithemia clementina (nom. ined.)]
MTIQSFSVALLLFLVLRSTVFTVAFNFKLHGLDYTLRIGPDWSSDAERCKTFDHAVADMTQLKAITNNIRTFSLNDCNSGDIMLRATQQVGGLGLWLGLWVGSNGTNFQEERTQLLSLIETYSFDNVVGLHVSSEAIYRGDLTLDQAMQFRNDIKYDMIANGLSHIPVTIAEIIDNLLAYPQLVTSDDSVVHFNQFPFWERTTNINQASSYMAGEVAKLQNVGSRQIVIGETGWADDGFSPNANPANEPSMLKWFRDFVCLAQDNNWAYYWFIAYDSSWQRAHEQDPDGVEGNFGLFTEDGTLKPFFQDFSIDCSQPPLSIDPDSDTFAPQASSGASMEPSLSPSMLFDSNATTTTPASSGSPSVSPTMSASPSLRPSQNSNEPLSNSTTLSVYPSGAPSHFPLPSDSTFQPSSASPSDSLAPSSFVANSSPKPGASPSTLAELPSVSPTRDPSSLVTLNVSSAASLFPTNRPTLQPSVIPDATTASVEIVVMAVQNLKLTLVGVSNLDAAALQQFTAATRNWYISIYAPKLTGRSLQEVTTFKEFDTDITVTSQDVANSSNTLTYDQSLSYSAPSGGEPADAKEVVLNPFKNDYLRATFYSQLQSLGEAFNFVSDTGQTPDGSQAQIVNGEEEEDGGIDRLILIAALCGFVGLLIVAIIFSVVRRRAKEREEKHTMIARHEPKDYEPEPSERTPSCFLFRSESVDRDPALDAYSLDAEQSMSTMDYDYPKVVAGNQTVVSTAVGTLGQNTRQGNSLSDENTRPDSFTVQSPLTMGSDFVHPSPWANLGPKYSDESNIYTIDVPAGKLGVVVDTPDDGPPVVYAIKDSSPLMGKLNIGDRLLGVDGVDVTGLTAVNTSRIISKRANKPNRKFTLLRVSRNW